MIRQNRSKQDVLIIWSHGQVILVLSCTHRKYITTSSYVTHHHNFPLYTSVLWECTSHHSSICLSFLRTIFLQMFIIMPIYYHAIQLSASYNEGHCSNQRSSLLSSKISDPERLLNCPLLERSPSYKATFSLQKWIIIRKWIVLTIIAPL